MSHSGKHLRHSGQQGERSPPAAKPWISRLAACACILVAGGAAYALLHFVILTRVPYAMLGKWLVVGGDMDGATLEFKRDGAMLGTVNMKGKEGKIKAAVEVDGETLRITSVNPYTKQPETDVQTIRTLSNDQFIIEDRKGVILKMQRLHE